MELGRAWLDLAQAINEVRSRAHPLRTSPPETATEWGPITARANATATPPVVFPGNRWTARRGAILAARANHFQLPCPRTWTPNKRPRLGGWGARASESDSAYLV